MKLTVQPKSKCVLSALIVVLILSICACTQVSKPGKNTDTPIKTPAKNHLYDYELIYAYHNAAYDTDKFAKLAGLLQSRDNLTVASTNYTEDNGVLRIDFQLKLSEKEPNYKIDSTKKMQDAIVLFAVFEYIKGVEFDFTQADYSFGGVPIMRADAEAILGQKIAPFGITKGAFTKDFPDKVQAVVWEPKVMDTVNYYHAMGLDE
ncbi:MAG: hypothetical protein ABFD18_14440 [Syntrophomonas sp.]